MLGRGSFPFFPKSSTWVSAPPTNYPRAPLAAPVPGLPYHARFQIPTLWNAPAPPISAPAAVDPEMDLVRPPSPVLEFPVDDDVDPNAPTTGDGGYDFNSDADENDDAPPVVEASETQAPPSAPSDSPPIPTSLPSEPPASTLIPQVASEIPSEQPGEPSFVSKRLATGASRSQAQRTGDCRSAANRTGAAQKCGLCHQAGHKRQKCPMNSAQRP